MRTRLSKYLSLTITLDTYFANKARVVNWLYCTRRIASRLVTVFQNYASSKYPLVTQKLRESIRRHNIRLDNILFDSSTINSHACVKIYTCIIIKKEREEVYLFLSLLFFVQYYFFIQKFMQNNIFYRFNFFSIQKFMQTNIFYHFNLIIVIAYKKKASLLMCQSE